MQSRRQMLSRSAKVASLLAAVGLLPGLAQAQAAGTFNAAAFSAKTMADLMKAVGGAAPTESKDVTVTGPDIAENGAVVPVGAATSLPGVKRLLILVEKNPSMLTAMFDVTDAIDANILTRVKMGPVVKRLRRGDDERRQGAVRAEGSQGHTRRLRRLNKFQSKEITMADPMRIRAQVAGDKATVRVLMAHEMESGQRKDTAGKTIPAWHIQDVTAQHNGKTVMTAQWGPAVSKNPFMQFTVKGAKAGDKITVSWVDNKGDKRSDEAVVS